MWLLLAKQASDPETRNAQLPVIVPKKGYSVEWAGQKLVLECMREAYHELHVNMHGILGVQHEGRVPGQSDGICFNTLITLDHSEEWAELSSPPALDYERYTWHEVSDHSLSGKILRRIKDRSLLPMHSL